LLYELILKLPRNRASKMSRESIGLKHRVLAE
jgi:hypothetical protein